jgi:hypothetical protein
VGRQGCGARKLKGLNPRCPWPSELLVALCFQKESWVESDEIVEGLKKNGWKQLQDHTVGIEDHRKEPVFGKHYEELIR